MVKTVTTGLWLATMVSAGVLAATVNPASLSFWLAEAMLAIGFVVAASVLVSKIGSDDQADTEDQAEAAALAPMELIPIRVHARR